MEDIVLTVCTPSYCWHLIFVCSPIHLPTNAKSVELSHIKVNIIHSVNLTLPVQVDETKPAVDVVPVQVDETAQNRRDLDVTVSRR